MTPTPDDGVRTLKLKWVLPESVVAQRAVNVLVQPGELGEVIVMFFDVRQPIVIGTPDEVREAWTHAETADAICVARLVIPTVKFVEFAGVFGEVARGIADAFREKDGATV